MPPNGGNRTQVSLFNLYERKDDVMGKYFIRNTPVTRLEQEMIAPRGYSSAILCGYNPHGANVDCQSCIDHRRQSRQTLICLHITEQGK